MITKLVELLSAVVILIISHLGYLGIVLAMAIESALIPLPSEVIMPFSGFLVSKGELNFYLVILFGAVGNVLGSLLAYALGYYGEERFVRTFIKKYGKWVLITSHDLEISESWFRNHGEMVVFASRILPVVRTFISLPAGIAKMDLKKFILYTFLGSLIWGAVLTQIGRTLGENWQTLGPVFRKFDVVIALVVIALGGSSIYRKVKHLKND